MTYPSFTLRQSYNFDTYAPAVLGDAFKGVVIVAVMDRQTAEKELDVQTMHVQLYPFLPVGTPNSPDAYDYVKVRFPSGVESVLGLAWIKSDSVELVQGRTITVVLANRTAGDLPRLRDVLSANNFTPAQISISS